MPARSVVLPALLVAAAVPFFLNLGATSIIDANEAFYTETPREMIESGDYIEPTFNDEPRLNKPPLSYWVVATFYHAFGVSLTSARLPIAIGALVMLATVYLLGWMAFSPRAGLLAALTLAATPRFLLFSRRIIIDVYTAMFLGLALACFALAERDVVRRRLWLVLMYVAVGLGVLTKGPVAIVLPVLVFGGYALVSGRSGLVRQSMLPAGVAIAASLVVPYYAALYARGGWEHIVTFVLRENVARYAEGVGAPSRGPFFYLPVLFADLYFPWSISLPAALALVPWRRVWRRTATAEGRRAAVTPATRDDLRLLLGLWVAVIVGFFSLSRGQQDLYILPTLAAVAPLVGGLLDGSLKRTWTPRVSLAAVWSAAVTLIVLALLGCAVVWSAGDAEAPLHLAGAWPTGLVLAGGSLAALALLWRTRHLAALSLAVATVVTGHWLVVLVSLPDFERYKPVPLLAAAVAGSDTPGAPVAVYRAATPSLVFYLRRHVTQVFDESQLDAYLRAHPDAFVVMSGDDRDALARAGFDLRVEVSAPRADGRLGNFVNRTPLPTLVLVRVGP
ncbi:MAG: glycosyltransferase family 39 protein [Acidobacteriota bacterium]